MERIWRVTLSVFGFILMLLMLFCIVRQPRTGNESPLAFHRDIQPAVGDRALRFLQVFSLASYLVTVRVIEAVLVNIIVLNVVRVVGVVRSRDRCALPRSSPLPTFRILRYGQCVCMD